MLRKYSAGFLLLLFFITPTTLRAESGDSERAGLFEVIQSLQAQIVALQQELDRRQATTSVVPRNIKSSYLEPGSIVTSYRISSQDDLDAITVSAHREYFEQLFALMPEQYDQKINRLVVYAGDDNEFDAFVETIPPQHNLWTYGVHQSSLANPGDTYNIELMLHELAHVVAYEKIVGLPNPLNSDCHAYFSSTSCPAFNSYLGQFVEEFWSDEELNTAREFRTSTGFDYQSAFSYYDRNSGDFVSDYAALSPEEDFAESLMFYLTDKPVKGREANAKLRFFVDYAEVQELKNYVEEVL